ncbi:unnamed protein product [Caretta caretta]
MEKLRQFDAQAVNRAMLWEDGEAPKDWTAQWVESSSFPTGVGHVERFLGPCSTGAGSLYGAKWDIVGRIPSGIRLFLAKDSNATSSCLPCREGPSLLAGATRGVWVIGGRETMCWRVSDRFQDGEVQKRSERLRTGRKREKEQ